MEAPELELQEYDEQPRMQIVTRPAVNPADMASLYKKMAQVMGDVGRVEKRGKSRDGYSYVMDEDLYAACRDAMSKAGIALIPQITHIDDSGKPITVHINFILACTDTGATVTIPWVGKNYNAPDKAISGAVTMAEKYMLKSTFLIATGDPSDDPDNDVSNTNAQENPRPAPRQRRMNTGINDQPQGSPPPAFDHDMAEDTAGGEGLIGKPRSTGSTNKLSFKGQFADGFDYTAFWTAVRPLYDNDKHRINSLNKMWDNGELTADMDTATALASVESHLSQKATEAKNDRIGKPLSADEWQTIATQFIDHSEAELLAILNIEKRQEWESGIDAAIAKIESEAQS